jgi:thymidylate synthase
MFTIEYEGINSFLVGMAKILLENGVARTTRGEKCWELPGPVMIKIRNPLSRWITIPERKWNFCLPYAESLWLALGRNDLEFIKCYLPKMNDFSDDGFFLRGGYGPRLRFYNGNTFDYKKAGDNNAMIFENREIDQFYYISECFKRDQYTRQAIITIGDPAKDCFDIDNNIKKTKDFPCTRSLHFIKNSVTNKLDLIVHLRSNDFIWGATAVNIFNYTFMQEFFASILGLEVGEYYHIANNLHYYDSRHHEMIEKLATIKHTTDSSYCYEKTFHSLNEFDNLLKRLEVLEYHLRTGKTHEIVNFKDDFFNDWAKVLCKKVNRNLSIIFKNPILNQISNQNNKLNQQ